MKLRQLLTGSLLATGLVFFTVSCQKNDSKKSKCKLITVTDTKGTDNTVYNITYNNDGDISTISYSGSDAGLRVFSYSGNTIIINSTNNGSFDQRDSITVDDKGRAVNVRQYYDQAGTSWYNTSLVYNSNGDLLKAIGTDDSAPGTPETTTCTSSGGNLVGLQSTSSSITLDYYTNKSVQTGDYLEMLSLLQYGLSIYPHKNLVKTIDSGGGDITNLSYSMDADGNISGATATYGTTTETFSYQYQCD